MKKFTVFLIVLILLGGGIGGYFLFKNIKEKARIDEIKKGWYVEITYDDPIKVRTEPSTNGKIWGEVKKGEIYAVYAVNLDNKSYFWYQIDFNGNKGWVASGRKKPWVKDVNNPTDIQVPEVRFKENVYQVATIKDINYKHLEVIEDSDDYEITHEIYHEVNNSMNIDQYWIKYTITDGAGKSSSKVQKIEFEINPDEKLVKDFVDLER